MVLNICLSTTLFREDSHFDKYCSKGLKPPTSDVVHTFNQHLFALDAETLQGLQVCNL